jgi:hypothetical protein
MYLPDHWSHKATSAEGSLVFHLPRLLPLKWFWGVIVIVEDGAWVRVTPSSVAPPNQQRVSPHCEQPPDEPHANLRRQLQRIVRRRKMYSLKTWVTLYSKDMGDTREPRSARVWLVGTLEKISWILLVRKS